MFQYIRYYFGISSQKKRKLMEKRMDPNEDIIDVLYKNKTDENGKNTNSSSTSPNHHGLKRQVQRQASIQTYGFAYTHPPSRNYYEDLFTIQRRNFHGSDSVFGHHTFEKRPLSRTDSISQVMCIYIITTCLLNNIDCKLYFICSLFLDRLPFFRFLLQVVKSK